MQHLVTLSAEQLDHFALAHPQGNWQQSSQMATFRKSLGWDVHLLGLYEKKSLKAAAVLAGKAGRYEVTMGPLLDFSQQEQAHTFLTLLADYVKSLKGHSIEVYPQVVYQERKSNGASTTEPNSDILKTFQSAGYTHKGFTVEYDHTANRWVFVKNLSALKSEEDLLMSYRQTTRQIIKKLDHARYSVRQLEYDELHILKALIDASNDKNGIPGRNLTYYQHLYTALGDTAQFLVVYYDETIPLSGAVFIYHPAETVYFISGTDTQYRQLYGGHFLQHHVMLQALKSGQSRYNFYGIAGHFDHNPLLVYKAGFKGHVEEYVGGFYKVVRPGAYHLKKASQHAKSLARKVLK